MSFVKWCGGKKRLVPHIIAKFPKSINIYLEPFVGGGAVFFELAKRKQFKEAIINDSNYELINAYVVLRDNVKELIKELKSSKYKYDRDTYLQIRSWNPAILTTVEGAARFIYLNKTGFNGLYRVNGNGQFNVPFGRYENPVICDEKTLLDCSQLLQKADIHHKPFEKFLSMEFGLLGPKDAIYFDPPYIPISKTSSFTSYTQDGFTKSDHMRLAAAFFELVDKGVKAVLTNSDCPLSRNLYSDGCMIEAYSVHRAIGGPAKYRHRANELIIHT